MNVSALASTFFSRAEPRKMSAAMPTHDSMMALGWAPALRALSTRSSRASSKVMGMVYSLEVGVSRVVLRETVTWSGPGGPGTSAAAAITMKR